MTISRRIGCFQATIGAAIVLAIGAFPRDAVGDDPLSGEKIYQAKCASCHGVNGQGKADSYAQPLVGDKSIGELTEYISKSMPEDKPGTCVGDEACRVSTYIHESFYSSTAQERNKPVRVELSRLTVRQYRNVMADLVGAFRPVAPDGSRRGLAAKYFKTREFEAKDLAFERIDPVVAFDFLDKSPDGEKIPPHEFAIRWEGGIVAPDTGEYEFHIRTDQSFRFWINDLKRPLIDAYVQSKTENDDRASIFLIGGRTYPLRLEFSKAKQGVQDGKAKELPPSPASVFLEWTQPHRVREVVPARCLSSGAPPEVCIVNTPFPPDDRSSGWEKATSISKEWDQATTEAAVEIAAYIDRHLEELSSTSADAPEGTLRLMEFCHQFATRAFRRPLDNEQRRIYVERQFEKTNDPRIAVNRVVLLVLKSPRFLYRELGANPENANDPYDVASRIAFAAWDSLPDQGLRESAESGRLVKREEIVAQAQRMVQDSRTRSKLREFILRWLRVERVVDLSKDADQFPDFDSLIADDLRTSLELSVDELLSSEATDFRQLLLADGLFLNGRLAKFYGIDLPVDSEFQKVSLDSDARAGVLTHPYLMSGFAYRGASSPIHRGVFIARSLLGRTLRPPPEAVTPIASKLQPDLTTRERVGLQTRQESCQSCHSLINPLGFTFEQFDAVGRFRKEESGKQIVSTGTYRTREGDIVHFNGAREVAAFLADSSETHSAFVQQLFHFSIKQPIQAYGSKTKETLRHEFEQENFSIRRLLVEIIATAALNEARNVSDSNSD
ncbi:DUF1592 domain-containing protein [Schlesneria paludicola]|uniref:DUF1592 domain-containing protein n=1 Tax=Schlesneria paludicola TaxID=360056 RepID=UPI00029AC92B|nr:DUF1592 domain-containing protein [Schlesneria paludicola]